MTGSDRRILTGILAVALMLRIGVALVWHAPLTGDAGDYHRLATGLAAGRGYVNTLGQPTAWRPPVYPAFLAGVYRMAGDGAVPVGLVQSVVGTVSVAAAFAVTALVFGSDAGLVAAGLVAVDAAQLSLTSRRLSEGLFTLLLLLLVLVSLRLRARVQAGERPWGVAVGAGVLAAVATLTRGLFVAYPFALALALLAEGDGPQRGRRRAARAALVLVLSYGIALVPWTLRNVHAVGAHVPVATQGGITLYSSWFPPGGVFGILADDEVTRALPAGLSEPEQSTYFTQATLRRLGEAPGVIPRLLVLKALFLVVPLDWEVLPSYGALNPTYLVAAAWAALFFVALGWGQRRRAWPLWLPIAYLAGMAMVFYGSPRLRAPVDPLIAALAAGAVVELARRRGRGFARNAWIVSVGGAVMLAVLAAPLKALALGLLSSVGLWRR